MDKLKPILEQKFWIFFGLVFILPFVGYFMTKGPLAAEIDTRWKALDSTYSAIPKGTGSPNETWAGAAKLINEQCERNNRTAHKALWQAQAAVMRWPEKIAADMKKVEYFKVPGPEVRQDKIRQKYGEEYPEELRTLWQIVDPLDDGKNFRDSNVRRKVALNMIDLQIANTTKWGEVGPDFPQMWAAQEDIWLQTELLNAIKRLNEPCNSQHDAYIRQIAKVILFGGTKSAGDTGAATQPQGGSSSSLDGGGGFSPFGGGAAGMGRGDASGSLSAEINLSEEFTASIETGGGTGFPGSGGSSPLFDSSSFASSSSPPPGGGGPGAAGATTEIKRYIDDDEKLPYKRRGFVISLVMDHREVPKLIAELMNSPFPVEIVRIHQAIYSDSGSPSQSGSGLFSGNTGFGSSSGLFSPTTSPTFSEGSTSPLEDSSGFGTGASSSPMGSARPTGTPISAMADPNLASVSIVGVWTLYRPPVVDPNQPPADAPSAAANNSQPVDSAANAATSPNDNPAEPAAPTTDKPKTDEPTESTPPANSDNPPGSDEKSSGSPASPATDSTDQPKTNNDSSEQ